MVYVLWRVFLAVYFFVWIILSGAWEYDWYDSQKNRVTWFIYLTNWSFFSYVSMYIIQAITATMAYAGDKKRTQPSDIGQ